MFPQMSKQNLGGLSAFISATRHLLHGSIFRKLWRPSWENQVVCSNQFQTPPRNSLVNPCKEKLITLTRETRHNSPQWGGLWVSQEVGPYSGRHKWTQSRSQMNSNQQLITFYPSFSIQVVLFAQENRREHWDHIVAFPMSVNPLFDHYQRCARTAFLFYGF